MPETPPAPLPRVLVCDDSATMRALIRSLLEPGHEVLVVETGEDALARAPAFRPDVIVSDLILPGISGSELCRRIRQTPGLADVPFILVTTLADATSRALGLEAGADDYLYKPLRERELRARVASLLRLRRAMTALEARTRELEATNAALRQAQSALVRAGKLASVGTLAAGLAHEINNPLSYIKAGARALERAVAEISRLASPAAGPPSAELAEALGDVRDLAGELADGSRRLERIAGDLRIIASPDAPAEELVDPAEAVESAFLLARSRYPAMPRLEMDLEPGPPVESVGRLLTQGLVPVVENAVQVSGPGGLVQVRIRQLNVGVEISIQDSGPGIAPEILPRIFDPFFSTRPAGQGMGLGLSVAYGIIHGLGGDIHVESTLGHGACFRVRLPRRASARQGAPPGS
ncbi:MAG: response regulator [Anaeromyxobacter sp.]|nr:response regulator [Anaeromyxobacter sp.]MBL0278389.1 response regulator [Anaeromyxobacter sp.]